VKKLLFGNAGVPLSTREHSSEAGVRRVRELGLDAMELEFVRGVKMGKETAKRVGAAAKEENVSLTCHAPFYVNLNSKDKAKLHASVKRILESARISSIAGAWSVTFHPGFYLDMEKEKVYSNIKKQLQHIVSTLNDEGIQIMISPETTGKKSQFGNLHELISLSQEVEGVMPCIDFAHMHARNVGKVDFHEVLSLVEKGLGKRALKNLHCHISGIKYSDKGELSHLNLRESDLDYKSLLKALREFNTAGVIISESPNIEGDAVFLQNLYGKHFLLIP